MIRSKDEDCVPYVGSTTKQYLSQRIEKHHSSYKDWKKNGKLFMSSFTLFEKYGFENCYIELLELCPCSCSEELRKKEREWFDKLKKCVNINRPFTTKEEKVEQIKKWYESNKEQVSEKGKIYYESNKEEIAEKVKIYRDEHKEENAEYFKIYRDEHKEQIAEYYKEYAQINKKQIAEKKKEYAQINKEHLAEYHKKWRDEHKEEIAEKKKEKYECPCGTISTILHKARHEKTKKHQNYLTTIGTLCSATIA